MNKTLKLFLKLIVGLLIVGLLFYKIGIGELYSAVLKINLIFIPISLGLTLISYLLSAVTLKILTGFFDSSISFWKILEFNIRSYSIGLFSPGRIGEFYFLYLLKKKKGLTMGKAV